MCWALNLLDVSRPSDQGISTIQKERCLEKNVDLGDNGVEVGSVFWRLPYKPKSDATGNTESNSDR